MTAATTASAIMGTITTDFINIYEDIAPATIGAELPDHFLDTFVDAELLDAADELAALLELRRRLERFRQGLQ
jgi:hypothetical protein